MNIVDGGGGKGEERSIDLKVLVTSLLFSPLKVLLVINNFGIF